MRKYILTIYLLLSICVLPLAAYQEPLIELKTKEEFQALYPHFKDFQPIPNNEVARFFLVRHGENEANALQLLDGRTLNLPLTEKGIEDALSAGLAIAQKIENIDLLISSPLVRTQQTAQGVMQAFSIKPEVILDDRLRERFFGIFEGRPASEFKHFEEKIFKVLPTVSTFIEKMNLKEHQSMESYAETYERMAAVILEFSRDNFGKNIVVTTHGASIRSLFLMATADQHNIYVPNERYRPTNGCILVIESDGETMEIKAFQGIEFR